MAPLPPANYEAEEYVLGAMMLSAVAIDAVRQILQPRDFSRESHGRIYRACLDLHDIGTAVDAITVADELDQRGELLEVGGKERIREIATLAPAATNAPHHAQIVVEMAELRAYVTLGERISRLGWEREGDSDQRRSQARDLVESVRGRGPAKPLELLTHQQVLELEHVAERQLVEDLIPAGAVGTIAGVPESHKSWLAQAIAIRVARGTGTILGKEVTAQGPVAYLWQDDSTREEAERVKAFESVHPTPGPLPILWGLNLGLQLPRDLPRLHQLAEKNHLALLVLDSFYNFLAGIDLKDEGAEQIVSALKRDISDATGCTVLIVDHMPWATDTNRGRLRAYGGVFKNAATRFGIYIDAVADKLHIEARGNNIRGIPKRLAYWDADSLELRLHTEQTEEDLKAPAAEIRDWVIAQGGDIQAKVVTAHFEIHPNTLTARLPRLAEMGIDYVGGRGKPGRLTLRAASEDPQNEQLEVPHPEVVRGTTNCGTENSTENFSAQPSHSDEVHGSSTFTGTHELETHDMQGKTEFAVPGPPTGDAYARRRARETPPARLAKQWAWVDAGGWMNDPLDQALLDAFPMTATGDLPTLIAHADQVAARELGT